MEKDFDTWNNQKKNIQSAGSSQVFCHEREVWWIRVGLNIGDEEDGKGPRFERPILIIKKFGKFLFWGCALSTKLKPQNKYYIPIQTKDGTQSVIVSQFRLYDAKRLSNKYQTLDTKEFIKVKTAIKGLL